LRNIGVFNNTLASNQEKAPQTEDVCWQKNVSVSSPSVPAEQFSTSVLAEQLSAIEVGVKKLHVVHAANDKFLQGRQPPELTWGMITSSFFVPGCMLGRCMKKHMWLQMTSVSVLSL